MTKYHYGPIDGWELCECNWLDPEQNDYIDSVQVCGCGESHCRLYRNYIIHWLGKHWKMECAFKESLARYEHIANEYKLFALEVSDYDPR